MFGWQENMGKYNGISDLILSNHPELDCAKFQLGFTPLPLGKSKKKKFSRETNGMWRTLEGSTLGKLLTTERTLSMTSSLVRWSSWEDINRRRVVERENGWPCLWAVWVRVWTGTRTWRSRAALNAISLSLSLSLYHSRLRLWLWWSDFFGRVGTWATEPTAAQNQSSRALHVILYIYIYIYLYIGLVD